MRLGSLKVLYITTALVSGVGFSLTSVQAYAQQDIPNNIQHVGASANGQQAPSTITQITADPNQNSNTVPLTPPHIPSQPSPNMLVAQPVTPAPRVEPMLSPQDMAARAAAQQQQMQQQFQPQQQLQPMQPMMPPQQQQQALVPVQTYDPQMQQQVMMQQQQNTALAAQPMTHEPAISNTPTTPVAAEQTLEAVQPTNATGFAPEAATTQIPMTSGMMPASTITSNASIPSNQGMDMSINPDLVGGYDPSLPASDVNPVPYEVQLEQRTRELQQQARAMAFEQAKRSAMPMETYEIRDVLHRLKDTQEAIQSPVRTAPTPSNVIKTISTDPSAKPLTIQLAAGNVSTLNFVDVTGEPWPIVDIGFGGAFDVKPPEAGGNVIRITPLRDFAHGNLVVRLLKMTTPLTFSLKAGGENVYYRFDARIPDYGPNAKMPLIAEGIGAFAGDKVTTSFLEGVPPTGAEKLSVQGVDARTTAFRFGGTMYVRTPLSLLSPAWQGSATSADGMNVYLLQETPVLLMSDKGALVRAHITDQKRISTGF